MTEMSILGICALQVLKFHMASEHTVMSVKESCSNIHISNSNLTWAQKNINSWRCKHSSIVNLHKKIILLSSSTQEK